MTPLLLALALLPSAQANPRLVRDRVEILELNSYGPHGRKTEQAIFWERGRDGELHAIAFIFPNKSTRLLHRAGRSFLRFERPPWIIQVEFLVLIRSSTFHDPEYEDRRQFPHLPRRGIGQIFLSQQPPPIPGL